MDLSIFLAQLIGIYLLVVGIAVLVRRKGLHRMTNQFVEDDAHLFVYSAFALIIGLVLVLSHNLWEVGGWQMVITIVGWLVLLKGVLAMLFPGVFRNIAKTLNNPSWYTLGGLAAILAGAYLVYVGFGLGV